MLSAVIHGVAAFCPTGGGCPATSAVRSRTIRSSAFDVWWEERQKRNTLITQQLRELAEATPAAGVDYGSGAAGRAALRAARAKAAATVQAAMPAPAADTLELDEDFWWTTSMMSDESYHWTPPSDSSTAQVLNEFVQSEFARQIFNTCSVSPTDIGQIRGMFESVRLVGTRLELKLARACQNREGLFPRLALYLRARMPECKEIHEVLRDGVNIYT